MQKLKNTLLIAISLLLVSHLTFAQIDFMEIESKEDWSNALEKAEQEDKLIFLDIYATWCGPCKYLDSNVYPDEKLGEIYNEEYVNAKIDGESEFGRTLVSKYRLTAYPTMYYLTEDEEIITTVVGVREAGPLGEIGSTVADNFSTLSSFSKRYDNNELSTFELIDYQSLLLEIGQDQKAADVAGKILPGLTEEDIMNPEYKDLIINSPVGLDSKVYKVLAENREEFTEAWSEEEVNDLYSNIYNNSLGQAIQAEDEKMLDRIVNELLPVYISGSPQELASGKYATRKLYLANINDWEGYDSFIRNEYQTNAKGDDSFFYREAYEIANDHNRNTEALELATELMQSALEINESVDNLVLMSFLNGMKGKYDTAREYIAQVENMELNEEQEALVNELKRLIRQAEEGEQ